MRLRQPVRSALAAVGLLAASAVPAPAHRSGAIEGGGIAIASLSHGQMAVYQRHYGAILRLAERHQPIDLRLRRIENYARIQKAWCLWGLMPGALTDEDSPFNECAHAYLAAARMLLAELRARGEPDPAVEALAATVDRELILAGAPVLCGFSGAAFNTAVHLGPRWREIGNHRPTLALFSAAGLLLLLGAAGGITRLRRPR